MPLSRLISPQESSFQEAAELPREQWLAQPGVPQLDQVKQLEALAHRTGHVRYLELATAMLTLREAFVRAYPRLRLAAFVPQTNTVRQPRSWRSR